MAKPELGSLNGGCFSKQPDFSTLPNQTARNLLFLGGLSRGIWSFGHEIVSDSYKRSMPEASASLMACSIVSTR
jgi:hypothetical protein